MPHPVKQDDPIPMKGGVLRHLLYKDVKRYNYYSGTSE